jgi:hypothetical protein
MDLACSISAALIRAVDRPVVDIAICAKHGIGVYSETITYPLLQELSL